MPAIGPRWGTRPASWSAGGRGWRVDEGVVRPGGGIERVDRVENPVHTEVGS